MKQMKKSPIRYPGLRVQIFFIMTGLVAVMLLILWVFQLFFLEPMYESVKTRELRVTTSRIASAAETSDIQAYTDKLAKQTGVCITLYEIVGRDAVMRAQSHIRGNCMIHNVSSDPLMNRLYAGAMRDTYYMERISESSFGAHTGGGEVPESIISARLATTSGGSTYFIVLNSEIELAENTWETLTLQLGIITLILLLLTAVIAVVISKHITRPITQMSAEARKLALGTYDVHFDGGTSRETAELGEALNYAAKELSNLDTMQKELIANISHDLRTPLTMISGYSEVMRDIPGEMTAENMQIVIDETKRLSALVSDIMDISAMTGASRNQLNCEVFSLTEAIRRTLDRYGKLRTHDGYNITFTCEREVFIYADRSKILQVVYNLVNNAINYTGEDKAVQICQITENGRCRIEVSDTGEGIPPEQLHQIWDRYYKVKNYYKRSVTGTGLGLSIVKNILLLHGAQFGVQSDVGKGSTFWFALPEVIPDQQISNNS